MKTVDMVEIDDGGAVTSAEAGIQDRFHFLQGAGELFDTLNGVQSQFVWSGI